MNTLISFIIPVYKVEKDYLEQCLNSLLLITSDAVEFILVDDGSHDGCGDICDQYSISDIRFKTFHKENEGVSIARNYGIKRASGKYISFIDADDWIESEKMDALIEKVKTEDYDVIVHGQYIDYRNADSVVVKPFESDCLFDKKSDLIEIEKMVFVRSYESLTTSMGAGVFCNAVDKLIKKKIIEDHGIYYNSNIKIGEDALFNLEVLNLANSVFYNNECIYHYRMRKASANHRASEQGFDDIKKFATEARKIIEKQGLEQELLTPMYYRCFDLIFEQMNRCYLYVDTPMLKKNGRLNKFKCEMNQFPFKQAISTVQIEQFEGKQKLKACMFKLGLGWMFLAFKNIKMKCGFEKQYEKKLY